VSWQSFPWLSTTIEHVHLHTIIFKLQQTSSTNKNTTPKTKPHGHTRIRNKQQISQHHQPDLQFLNMNWKKNSLMKQIKAGEDYDYNSTQGSATAYRSASGSNSTSAMTSASSFASAMKKTHQRRKSTKEIPSASSSASASDSASPTQNNREKIKTAKIQPKSGRRRRDLQHLIKS